jgi:hypothetical protein
MRWTIEESEFDSLQKQEICLFSTRSRPSVEPTKPLTHWVPGTFSPKKKRSGREVDHSLPHSTMVSYAWRYAFRPSYVLNAMCLIKRWDNFALTLNNQVMHEPSMRLLLSVALGMDTKSCSWCGEGHASRCGTCQTGLAP